jgi:hypothetical protein
MYFSNAMPAPLHPLFSFVVNLTGQRAAFDPGVMGALNRMREKDQIWVEDP